jgi:hypothetical protein
LGFVGVVGVSGAVASRYAHAMSGGTNVNNPSRRISNALILHRLMQKLRMALTSPSPDITTMRMQAARRSVCSYSYQVFAVGAGELGVVTKTHTHTTSGLPNSTNPPTA